MRKQHCWHRYLPVDEANHGLKGNLGGLELHIRRDRRAENTGLVPELSLLRAVGGKMPGRWKEMGVSEGCWESGFPICSVSPAFLGDTLHMEARVGDSRPRQQEHELAQLC